MFNARNGRLFTVKGGITEEDILQEARKIAQNRLAQGPELGSSKEAKALAKSLLRDSFLGLTHYEFGMLILDTQHKVIRFKVIFRGFNSEGF